MGNNKNGISYTKGLNSELLCRRVKLHNRKEMETLIGNMEAVNAAIKMAKESQPKNYYHVMRDYDIFESYKAEVLLTPKELADKLIKRIVYTHNNFRQICCCVDKAYNIASPLIMEFSHIKPDAVFDRDAFSWYISIPGLNHLLTTRGRYGGMPTWEAPDEAWVTPTKIKQSKKSIIINVYHIRRRLIHKIEAPEWWYEKYINEAKCEIGKCCEEANINVVFSSVQSY